MKIKSRFLEAQNTLTAQSIPLTEDNIPDWNQLPVEIWLKVLDYLVPKDLNSVHLVSRKFHSMANKIATFLNLSHVLEDTDILLSFIESNRVYFHVFIDSDMLTLKQSHIALLEPSTEIIQHLHFRYCDVSSTTLYNLLKMLPNLDTISLYRILDHKTKMRYSTEFSKINLPKLKQLYVNEVGNECCSVIEVLECPALSILKIMNNDQSFALFIQSHVRSLESLNLDFSEGIPSHRESNYTALFANLADANLNYMDLYECRIDPPVFAQFLRGQRGLTNLKLKMSVNDEVVSVICDFLQNLKVLDLDLSGASAESFNEIHRLRKLEELAIHNNRSLPALQGLLLGNGNPNLKYLEVYKLHNATPRYYFDSDDDSDNVEFLNELNVAIPNLKKLKIRDYKKNIMKKFLKIFKGLEHLEFRYHGVKDGFRVLNDIKDYSHNLKIVTLLYHQDLMICS